MSSKAITKRNKPKGPHIPLDPKRERFCLAICDGHTLKKAHTLAGFQGASDQAAWQLRHSPPVDARIRWMLDERVKADTRSFARKRKSSGDLLARVVSELEAIAFQDIRELVDWRREAVLNADGEVIDTRETMQIRDAKALTPSAAKAVKAVFYKGERIRIDLHDKRAALETLAKILKGDDVAATVTNNTTINAVNVGAMSAIDAAQRVAFLLSAVSARQPAAPKTIDVTPAPPADQE